MSDVGDERNSFGARLTESRRLCGLTQEELAGRLGVTPQALSKWERGISFPDLEMTAEICSWLEVSADYLLGIAGGRLTEDGNLRADREICRKLRHSLDSLRLIFGEEVLPLFQDNGFVQRVAEKRLKLAEEGILMPVLRVMDQLRLAPREFMILAYDNVLYQETLEEIGEGSLGHMMEKLEETVRSRYGEIVNADILKRLVDNLRTEQPALIAGIVPEKISYGLLLDVCRELFGRGEPPCYLPLIIERLEHETRERSALSEKGALSARELAERVAGWLERPNRFSR